MKLAIIGTGFIPPITLQALAQIPAIEVTSIYAREHSKARGQELANQFNIPKVYTDYRELLEKDSCDFVYIANVNPVHYEFTKEALLAGKNVILEKPTCVFASQIEELASLAQEKHLYLMEAITPLHNPNYHHIQDLLPSLGNIKLVQCNYSQYSSRYNAYKEGKVLPALDPTLYGGALYDINIYNINVVVGLFGKPESVDYIANIGFNGVDTSGTVILKYPTFFAHLTGAKDSESPGHVTIQGDEGYIEVHGPTHEFKSFDFYQNDTKEAQSFHDNLYEHRMVHEFLEFEEMYRTQNYDAMVKGLETSIEVIRVVEKAIASAGLTFGKKERD